MAKKRSGCQLLPGGGRVLAWRSLFASHCSPVGLNQSYCYWLYWDRKGCGCGGTGAQGGRLVGFDMKAESTDSRKKECVGP